MSLVYAIMTNTLFFGRPAMHGVWSMISNCNEENLRQNFVSYTNVVDGLYHLYNWTAHQFVLTVFHVEKNDSSFKVCNW